MTTDPTGDSTHTVPQPNRLRESRPARWNQSMTADVIAGVTLAAVAIPECMGYTKIVGTPVVTGLYTLLLPTVAFAWIGSSRHLVVAADSATAAILFAGLFGLATPFSPHWLALTSAAALETAVLVFARHSCDSDSSPISCRGPSSSGS